MMLVLAAMMLSVALGLKTSHFGFMKRTPRVFFAGVFGQLLVLPLLTLGLCFLLAPRPSAALGMILVSCCPGGNVSNVLVLLARGNTALSVSLTATSSFAAAFITPIAIIFWSSLYPPTASLMTSISFDATSFLLQTALVLVMPLAMGMACAHYLPAVAAVIQKPLVVFSSISLMLIIVGAYIQYADVFLAIGVALIGVVALHNALAFLAGNMVARVVSAGVAERRALTYEVGIQNSGLGLVILMTQLGGLGGAATVISLWGAWHILAGLSLAAFFRCVDWSL